MCSVTVVWRYGSSERAWLAIRLPPVQNLDRSVGDARLDGRTDQPRWNRVIVLADLDVIVGRDHALVPFGIAVRLGRKRIERWPIDRFQQLGPALADLAHHLGVEIAYALPDGGVEFDEREEPPVAQPRQDEALDDLHGDFHLGFVARFAHARRQHHKAVMLRKVLIAAIDAGLVARRLGDADPEIVAYYRLRYAADRREGVDVSGYPVGKPLRPARFRIGVVGRTERGDEDVSGTFSIRYLIEHRHRVAGVIDK